MNLKRKMPDWQQRIGFDCTSITKQYDSLKSSSFLGEKTRFPRKPQFLSQYKSNTK